MRGKFALLIFVLMFSCLAGAATVNEINYTSSNTLNIVNPQFTMKTLKYEPYPVSPGNWFDVWIKVQNIGEKDAPNTEFKLTPTYPFSSNDSSIRDYGTIDGTINAYKKMTSDETAPNTNQVLLKYRVYAAENAPAGKNILKLEASSDKDSNVFLTYNLPIDIEDSEVNFDITEQTQNTKSVFTITNIGEAGASNILIKINNSEWNIINGDKSINFGKINPGDFTQFSIEGTPITKDIHFYISYTDISGTRKELTLSTEALNENQINVSNVRSAPYMEWIFGLIGMLIGILIMIFSRKIHKKKRSH